MPLLLLGGFFMKIIHKICCGMDVHKDIIVATIATTNSDGIMFVWNPQENTGFLFLMY